MSVPLGDRGGKLKVLNSARKLNDHTFKLCRSDKTFPKSQRWVLPNRMMDTTLGIYMNIRMANSIELYDGSGVTDPGYLERRSYQMKARQLINAFYGMLDIALGIYCVPFDKIQYWTELTCDTETLLEKWMESDTKRVSKTKIKRFASI